MTPRRAIAILSVALLSIAPGAYAQAPESERPPEPGRLEGALPDAPATGFLLPDLAPSGIASLRVETPAFTLKPGLVLIGDYTAVNQDAASLAQVGPQDDRWQIRAARLMLRGSIGRDYKVGYLVAGEYKGFESDPLTTWNMTDVSLSFPLGTGATQLTVGKTKQTHVYEMVGDAANLPQMERVLNPFFVSRSVGAKIAHISADRRSTLAFGVFNDSWAGSGSPSNDGTDVSARVTHAAWLEDRGRRLLHLGASVRRADDDNGTMRYRGRPESNVIDDYVDTGSFAASHAWHGGLEALWQDGAFSVLGEFVRAWVRAPDSGNPVLDGAYVTASWVVSGESRPYDPVAGYARRILPGGSAGAVELVGRLSRIDLDDAGLRGGRFTKTFIGANWWATNRWRIAGGWGRTWLDRNDSTGVTDALLLRMQWVY
jgi:phosphate-selective porin OprO and OprP